MDFKKTDTIYLPSKSEKKKFSRHEFVCNYLDEVAKFISIVDKSGFSLLAVIVPKPYLMHRQYIVMYEGDEPIEMEVKC